MPARTNPPFTRLNHPDPATNRVVQDIYDKLNAVTQTQGQAPASPATPAPATASNLRKVTTSTTLHPADQTVSAIITADSTVLLRPTSEVAGKGPFVIQNQSGSNANLSLGSARGELVGGVAANSYSLLPGQSLTVQPGPGYWIIVGQV